MPPPRFISCQLCGQQFGSSSIGIHVPQCHEKMHKRWQNMDPKTRGAPPPVPMALGGGSRIGGGGGGVGMRSSSASASMRSGGGVGGGRGGINLGGVSTLGKAAAYGGGFDNAPIRGGGGGGGVGGLGASKHVPQTQFQFGQEYQQVSLNKCRKCGRGFSYDRLAYHESVCIGASGGVGRKRREFNSKKQRLSDFDSHELGYGGGGGGSRATTLKGGASSSKGGLHSRGGHASSSYGGASAQNRTNWRQQHHEFITAIREAKKYAPPKQYTPSAPPRGGGGPRAPFQGSVQRNMVTTRHQFQQQNISSHAAMGNGARSRAISSGGPSGFRSGGGSATYGTTSSGYGGGGGGGGYGSSRMGSGSQASRAFGGGGDRFSGGGGGGWGGGGGGGGARIANSNECSLGMLQAFGRM